MVRREVLYVLPRPEEHKSVKAPGGQRHLLRKHWPPTASPASRALLLAAPAWGSLVPVGSAGVIMTAVGRTWCLFNRPLENGVSVLLSKLRVEKPEENSRR